MCARNKYNAVQTTGDDGTSVYDSILERDCARVLDLLASQGRIAAYERQVPYQLAGPNPALGLRAVRYVADFWVLPPGPLERACAGASAGVFIIECKGYTTRAGALKIRWFQEKYPHIPLRVVRAPQDVIAAVDACTQTNDTALLDRGTGQAKEQKACSRS